jgi:hypothetical protein
MNIMGGAWRSQVFTAALCVAAGTALLPLQSVAADGANFEGTWKLAATQTSFKPEGGSIPFTAEGKKTYQANKRHQAKHEYDAYDYAMERCSSPGLTRLMLTPDRFRIWQRPGLIMIQFEWNRTFRQINTGDGPPQQQRGVFGGGGPGAPGGAGPGAGGPGAGAPSGEPAPLGGDTELTGRAIPGATAHWEADTLVAESKGYPEAITLLDDLVPHGMMLKVTERIRQPDSNTLEDRMTFEDPEYFTKPWQTVVVYKRQADEPFREDVCLDRHEAGQPAL